MFNIIIQQHFYNLKYNFLHKTNNMKLLSCLEITNNEMLDY